MAANPYNRVGVVAFSGTQGGGTSGGVTAATAIAALQEAGGKLSRNMIADGYDAFGDVVTLVIELVRQFYGLRRQFRLLGRACVMNTNNALTSIDGTDAAAAEGGGA